MILWLIFLCIILYSWNKNLFFNASKFLFTYMVILIVFGCICKISGDNEILNILGVGCIFLFIFIWIYYDIKWKNENKEVDDDE